MEGEHHRYRTVLTIAGSDGSGGAGIQADIKTIESLGCHALSTITALTAQNTLGVEKVLPVPAEFITRQIEVLLRDITIDAIKIGMLGSCEAIDAVADAVQAVTSCPTVLDTVICSSSGTPLLPQECINRFIEKLFPITTLITPNLPETARLLGMATLPESRMETERAAEKLLKLGCSAALVKGGHMQGPLCEDLLVWSEGREWFSGERIATRNTHGTGCTLSSAIAANLALGTSLPEAVGNAREYLREAMKAGASRVLGHGSGPLCHLWLARQ
ncbi:bifunctional hydroxymethylpyrimidine kinase/phosphomethylpyrimidine kinase [Prosthecochloris sp. CIB 2401]|uniref:bifunctional hydroxymethylpyrimidine kinase/phosphomethylpyrimidine kinase n=1 Tax=Prosthecochloris sp. CIB 2401 TaxID=1868325 RepID=UPI00080ABC9C|nr:bifunctional hydroxymethylpyrimidine kinase/phosphomethylpyrimidine kinase [Prosthecochloris sp. CIB 2401]ANT64841.1 Hydroxymethylpyrimidine/phosphomethylpyrimidine kinase [Prosthecochloris sp. CIB 2401]